MRHFYRLVWILLLFCCRYTPVQGQTVSFQINRIEINKDPDFPSLDVYANVKEDDADADIGKLTIDGIVEQREGGGQTTGLQVLEKKSMESDVTVIFLLDVSGSMEGDKFAKAKEAIRNAIIKNNFPERSTFLATFEDSISSNIAITKRNYNDVLKNLRLGKDTDLYAALRGKVEDLKKRSGRRILILVSDGKNDNVRNPKYNRNGATRVTEDGLINAVITPLDSLFGIFAIGVGDSSRTDQDKGMDARFLRRLVGATRYEKDEFTHARSPDELNDVLSKTTKRVLDNLLLKIIPEDGKYDGILRNLTIKYQYKDLKELVTEPYSYTFGSPGNVIELSSPADIPWLSLFGVLLLLTLLLLFIYLFPLIKYQNFKQKYVRGFSDYKQEHNIKTKIIDNYTTMPIEDNEKVVVKCSHVMTLGSWIDNNDHCYEYPMRCEHGTGDYRRTAGFFQQAGGDRSLNWLWFGGVAGLLAWISFSLIKRAFDLKFYEAMFRDLLLEDRNTQISETLAHQSLVGVVLGFFITIMLSIVEERGQSRELSYSRIFVRSILALVVSTIMFPMFEWMRLQFIPHPFLGPLIEWVLFGSLIGLMVTVDSSIESIKGLKGGVIASVAAFLFYYFLPLAVQDANYANLLSWICYGSVLGLVLVTVVQRLEDFELDTVSPDKYKGRAIPISKWLKSREVYIGSHPSCDVKIKWADAAVAAQHAVMTYDGNVYIEPVKGEQVLINTRLIGGKTKLHNGDLIQLGMKSNTILRFVAKTKSIAPAAKSQQPAGRPRIVIKSK